ncbi:MAG: class I SAM-dependent methyltransferase [Candidatus Limnocylindrales bacterium]
MSDSVPALPEPITWCTDTITARYPAFQFSVVDVYNERYNPGGSRDASGTGLPFADRAFDVVYAYSVFSHMVTADVAAYLVEVARVMAPAGVAVVTAFVEPDVLDESVNPPGYQGIEWKGALHCVRFSRDHFAAMLGEAGLRIRTFEHGGETDGQSRFVLEAGVPPA